VAIACSHGPSYYVERGKKFSAAGKLEDASIQYRKALAKDPKLGQAYYELGVLDLQVKNFREAYNMLTRAVELMPNSDEAKVKLADVCLEEYLFNHQLSAFYQQVIQLSDQLLAKNPISFDGLRLKGSLALSDRKIDDAVPYLQKANQVKPGDPDLIVALTQALIFNNQFDEGERLAAELIQKDKAFGPIYDVLYRQYIRANRPADAERILKTKVENNPKQAGYVLQLANYYLQAQKPAAMARTLERLLDNPKDFANAHLLIGDFYGQIGKWEEAVAQFQEGARSNPKESIQYDKRIVKAMLAQGKRVEASQIVDGILRDHPKDEESRAMRARLLLENGKPEDLNSALAEFQSLLKDRPEDATLHYDLALARLAKGDSDAARTEFQEAIRRRNVYVSPRLLLAGMSLKQQKPNDALRYSNEILSYDSGNSQARLLRASALTSMGNYNNARSELAQLAKQFPESQSVLMQLGVVAIGQKKFKEAEDIFSKLRESGPGELGPAQGLVETYAAEHRFDKALQLLGDELKKSPDSTEIRMLLASTATRSGKYDLAVAEYQQLLAKTPKSSEVYLRLGDIYRQKGDWNNAITMFQQANRLAPKNPTAASLLGNALMNTGRAGEARTLYQQLLQLHPDDPYLQNSLAYAMTETGGNPDEAQRLVQRALQKVPGQLNFADTLGSVYLKKRMTESAIQIFRNLVRQDAKNPTFRYHLGMALLEKGDKAGAKSELKEALVHQPSSNQERLIAELISKLN
jgi:tetratricopeptide (TPR) repeat protein